MPSSWSSVGGNGAYGMWMVPSCTSGASSVAQATVSSGSSKAIQCRMGSMYAADPGTCGTSGPPTPPVSSHAEGGPAANGKARNTASLAGVPCLASW